MEKLKTGDLVRLKSGGPKMTINTTETIVPTSVDRPYTVFICKWFIDGKEYEGKYSGNALEKISD